MRGELLWFNEVRQDGLIRTERGEDVVVLGASFPGGRGPVGRCAGTQVTFDLAMDDGAATAVDVSYASVEQPRRARIRRKG